MSKLKALADDNLNLVQMMVSVFDWIEDILVKGENAGNKHFLLFLKCFQKVAFFGQ